MRPEDRESLLWDLSEIADRAPTGDALVPDTTLRAYRRGDLGEDEVRQVERLLMANPANRRRLEEIAGLAPAAAPAALRRRVLDATAGSGSNGGRRSRRWWPALAAAALVAIAAGWLILRPRPPALPAYEVQIAALTERRDSPPSAAAKAEAYADSMVTITATVVERAVAGVEVGLYRVAGGRLERLSADDRIEWLVRPGAVRIRAPAAALVGSQAGRHEVFVAVGRSGRLPAAVVVDPGTDPAAALAAGGRQRVYRLTLRLLPTAAVP